MNILIVQRRYMHYRKLLFTYLCEESSNMHITVADTNKHKNQLEDRHLSFKSTIISINMFGKRYELNYSTELLKYISKNCRKYDIIILEGTTNLLNNMIICRILKHHKVPFVIWDAGRRIGAKMTPARRLVHPLVKATMNSANACIAYSSVAKKYMMSIGIPEEKVFVCQNTLNVSYFDKQIDNVTLLQLEEVKKAFGLEGKKIILYVGALERRKRVEDLLYAFSELKDKNYSLIIVGDGEYRNVLENICKDLKTSNVFFTGQVIENVIKYYMICDVFVLPSEGGLSINQAMICSKPVIASSADGTERDLIINGENGYIFEEGNQQQLKECIVKVLEGDHQGLGVNSRKFIDIKANERLFKSEFVRTLEYVINTSS